MMDLETPITPEERAKAKKPVSAVIVPVPAPKPCARIPKLAQGGVDLGKPSKAWPYYVADGMIHGYAVRWDKTEARDKIVRPLVWDGKNWKYAGFGKSRPLLNLPFVVATEKPILLVEGEKSCDGAQVNAGDGWQATTWQGGAGAIEEVDWSPLAGKTVVLWPDNDAPGIRCMAAIEEKLLDIGARVAMIQMPTGMPDKWDLGDPLPPELPDPVYVQQVLDEAKGRARIKFPTEEEAFADPPEREVTVEVRGPGPNGTNGHHPPEPPPHDAAPDAPLIDEPDVIDPNADISSQRAWQVLGYSDQRYFILSGRTQQVHSYSARDLVSRGALLDLEDFTFWAKQYASEGGNIPWHVEGSKIMEQCWQKGPFDPAKIRGIGVWEDRKRVVVHVGSHLLVNKQRVQPAALNSKFVYPRVAMELDLESHAPLDIGGGRALLNVCRKPSWGRTIYGDLLAGWIATACITGSLDWRTHVWLTGSSGAGKSFVVRKIIQKALGKDFPIYSEGDTSPAGLRQTIVRDARPVIFDEAEANTQSAVARRQEILNLMRVASTEGPGSTHKGTSGHVAVAFRARCQFLLSSVEVGLRERADERRSVVLRLVKRETYTEEQKKSSEKHFTELSAAIAALPDDTAPRLFLRMVNMLNIVRENTEIFTKAFALSMGGREIGDKMSALLAGSYALVSDKVIDMATADAYVRARDWDEFAGIRDQREEVDIISFIAASVIRTPLAGAGMGDRSVGELAAVAAKLVIDPKVSQDDAIATLNRWGIKYDPLRRGFWFGHGHKNLDSIMEKSAYSRGYIRILEHHPNSVPSQKAMRIGGVSCRGTYLPAEVIVGDEKPDPDELDKQAPPLEQRWEH